MAIRRCRCSADERKENWTCQPDDEGGLEWHQVKNTKAAMEMMPEAVLELPYDGAKEMFLVDDIENKEFLRKLLETMYDELPAPKKKKEKKSV